MSVKPQTGVGRRPDSVPDTQVGGQPSSAGPLSLRHSETQLVVLGILQEAGRSLTVKQLQARVLCSAGALEEALDVLLRARLIARLNTIIPSYVSRSTDGEVGAEYRTE
jgi:hypothetical protein